MYRLRALHLAALLAVPLATATLMWPSTCAANMLATASSALPDDGDDDEELALDENGDYDVAAEIRRQLAKGGAPAGSGGPVQACVLSGRVSILGTQINVRDCMQSNGKYSVGEFQQACQGLANGLQGTGNAPARIEYMARCPLPAQGSCLNALNRGLDAYYYQRDAADLATLPASCAGAGGTWKPTR